MVDTSFSAPQLSSAEGKRAKRILVVDDEVRILRSLWHILTANGYEVLTASGGLQGLELAQQHAPDLVLLDLAMSGVDGFSVCRELRQWTATPIIVVSVLDEERLKVLALDLGADDYLIKPFGTEELLARIRVCLRRSRNEQQADAPEQQAILTSDDGQIVINLFNHRVLVGAREVHLNRKEFELLHHLMRASGRVVTHRALLRAVWGPEYEQEMDSLRNYIRQLRLKVEQDASHPQYIVTEPGIGYVFRARC
jgi:two-component system KDP operon response regulator KdpE